MLSLTDNLAHLLMEDMLCTMPCGRSREAGGVASITRTSSLFRQPGEGQVRLCEAYVNTLTHVGERSHSL